ncbi:MAG: mechanosensitive ion channel family protein [Maritimibacter harenae]|jgi:small conductance mechanosensitive channel|uniref:Small-conductance mechanosensitive channel n=1 Tax=Maritimibacter harenae TaxID=2606218 RepID=A0A845M0I8_9RHOB|nr:mechanosensitive ion channel domain-containing protein [Maritimibacter harenae]MZR13555.1 mechanosensitive ion channel [Maritimibacter harenae]
MEDQIATWLNKFGEFLPYIMNGIKALIILIVGWIVASAIARMVRKRLEASERIDQTVGSFVSSVVRWVLIAIVLITVLNVFGVEVTSLVAMLGAATLAIGLALQGTLGDLAAGFMIILFRPYRNGQYVSIDGTSGTVKEINLFFTELATPDNVQIVVPNGKAWGAIITNWSHHETRRVDLTMGIDYADDIDKALEVMLDMARADQRVHDDPEPWARVTNLGDSSVDLTMRMWADAADYWDLKFEFTKNLKEAFDAAGLSIPFPHRTLYVQAEPGTDTGLGKPQES